MEATIRIKLTDTGRKANLLAGGSASREQSIKVPFESPEFRKVVELGTLANDAPYLDFTGCYDPGFDHLPTAAEAISVVETNRAEKLAEKEREVAERYARWLTVVQDKKTIERTHTINGVQVKSTFTPDWPSAYDNPVLDLPETKMWLAELAIVNEEAERFNTEAMTVAKIKREEAEKITAAKEQNRRDALGLQEGELDLSVEENALTSVPYGCWKSHNRAKNWLATIAVDPSKPGGFDRVFHAKARGDYYYLIDRLNVGDAIEFGADYYSGSGRKSPTRWYGIVIRKTNTMLVVKQTTTGKAACKAAAKIKPPDVADQVEAGIARINSEGAIVPSDN